MLLAGIQANFGLDPRLKHSGVTTWGKVIRVLLMPRGSYSQVIRAGSLVFTAGFGPVDPATEQNVGDTIEEQTARVLDNLEAALAAAGCGLRDVVKVTTHLAHLDEVDSDTARLEAEHR